jgi:putative ABC transport system substrate-binding protein
MRRREFIAGLGGAAVWPLTARAQPTERVRRIGVLIPYDENDPLAKPRLSALTQALADLGWIEGRNMRIELRWGGGDINRMQALAQELVGLRPDIIVANTTPATAALQRETRTIPIVSVNVTEPVASGLVAAYNQPGGNITGFGSFEDSMEGKWLELLLEIAPELRQAAIMFNPDLFSVSVFMPSFEAAARSFKVEPIIAPVHSDGEIGTAIITLGREPWARAARRPCRRSGWIHVYASHADHMGGGPKQCTGGLWGI